MGLESRWGGEEGGEAEVLVELGSEDVSAGSRDWVRADGSRASCEG